MGERNDSFMGGDDCDMDYIHKTLSFNYFMRRRYTNRHIYINTHHHHHHHHAVTKKMKDIKTNETYMYVFIYCI